jgi:glycosyltransferase involved in cell wall biosynthesis
MPPTFSVVIPTYNQADFLRAALKSVLAQTFQDFEIVVVNNYSTDDTLDVIRRFDDGRIRVINYHNEGLIGAARNIGIKASNAPWVAFLDSDDSWNSRKLEEVAKAIEAYPGIGLVCHNQQIVREGQLGKTARFGPPSSFRGSVGDYLMQVSNCVCTSSTVVARAELEKVGNFSEDPSLVTVEDYDLWLKLSRVCRFHFIPDVLGIQNFHRNSASADPELHLRSTLAIIKEIRDEARRSDRPLPRTAVRRHYANAFFGAARQYHRKGVFREPFGLYIRTIRAYPLSAKAYAGMALLFIDILMGRARRRRMMGSTASGG